MIRLTLRDPVIVEDDEWHARQREFARSHCVVFRGFVDESILGRVSRMLETSRYFIREDVGKEGVFVRDLTMDASEPLAGMFFILLNQPRLFEAMAEFTGCETPIRYFWDRSFKQIPGDEHFDSWHSDTDRRRERLYGLSINLSREPFVGDSFRIRSRTTGEVLRAITTSRFGDACLFRIDDSLEHKASAGRGAAMRGGSPGRRTTGRCCGKRPARVIRPGLLVCRRVKTKAGNHSNDMPPSMKVGMARTGRLV